MKKTLLTIFAAALSLSLTAQTVQRTEFSFSSKHTAHFIEKGCYHASIGKGEIEFVGKKATLTVGNKKQTYPAAEGTRKGDYWLMSVPVQNIKAGTAVDLWFPFIAEPSDDRYAFAFEYLDGKSWKPVCQADKKGVNCYSSKSDKWPNFLWHTIRLENEIKSGNLLIRLRHCDKAVTKSTLYGSGVSTAPKVVVLGNSKPKDVTRVLFIGNSYTYYNHYPMMLKEIAWHEGHELDCGYYTHGGYTMKQHLADHVSRQAVEEGGYDYAFLQDQSLSALRIGTSVDKNVVGEMGKMVKKVKQHSPNAKCLIEMTWGRRDGNNTIKGKKLEDLVNGYPQFFTSYDAMQKVITENVTTMAEKLGVGVSPVGIAWEIVRRERPEIELYVKDGSHPSYTGSYLAAAVGYLTLFKEPFKADTPVRVKPEVAKYLRSVAERVVLKGEK